MTLGNHAHIVNVIQSWTTKKSYYKVNKQWHPTTSYSNFDWQKASISETCHTNKKSSTSCCCWLFKIRMAHTIGLISILVQFGSVKTISVYLLILTTYIRIWKIFGKFLWKCKFWELVHCEWQRMDGGKLQNYDITSIDISFPFLGKSFLPFCLCIPRTRMRVKMYSINKIDPNCKILKCFICYFCD